MSERLTCSGLRPRRQRCSAAECVGWPIQFELLEPRIMWSTDGGSLAVTEAGVAYGSFADNGTVRVDGSLVEGTRNIVLQPDGKMIVAAWSRPKTLPGQPAKDQSTQVTLLRLTRGGKIDTAYGTDGFVRFDVSQPHFTYDPLPLALQADGKLIVGGDGLRRFNVDGTFDATFGTGGVATDGAADLVRTLAVTADGQIIVAGWSFEVYRFNSDGTKDTTFPPAHEAWNRNAPNGHLWHIFVQPDGKIVMTGEHLSGGSSMQDPMVTRQMLVRLNADGTPDTTFGNGGVVQQAARDGHRIGGTAAAMQPDGKVVLGGYGDTGMVIARYDNDGSLDEAFGDDGMFFSNDGGSPIEMAVDDQGRIAISASYGAPSAIRLNPDGTLDTTFGRFFRPLHSDHNFAGSAAGLAIEPDGDVLLTSAGGGESYLNINIGESLADIYVTRIGGGSSDVDPPDPDPNPAPPPAPPPPPPPVNIPPAPEPHAPLGEPDTSFGGDGTVVTSPTSGVDRAQTVLVQPDGKTIVVGYSGTFTGPDEIGDGNVETHVTLVRYNADGSLDASFGDGGVVSVAAANLVQARYEGAKLPAALQADGKIVVGGTGLYRFNADGSADASFGSNGVAAAGLLAIEALAVLPSGRIVISTTGRFTFSAYHGDGTLDTGFGGAARSTAPAWMGTPPSGNVFHTPSEVIGAWTEMGEMIAQPDGKVIAVGTIRTLPHEFLTTAYYVVRMNGDGSLDQSFGEGGVVITAFPTFPLAEGWAVALQTDGKIVVSGSGQRGTLARYNADGSLDASFGDGGLITTSREGAGADVAVQSDGKIVLTTGRGANRYRADGSFDRQYIAAGFEGGTGVAIGRDGDIVLVAQPAFVAPGGRADFVVARFEADVEAPQVAPAPSPFSSFSNDSGFFFGSSDPGDAGDEEEEEDLLAPSSE